MSNEFESKCGTEPEREYHEHEQQQPERGCHSNRRIGVMAVDVQMASEEQSRTQDMAIFRCSRRAAPQL